MELILLAILAFLLIFCTFLQTSVLYGLLLWLILILFYGFRHGCKARLLLSTILHKISSISGVLITFALIGMLSAVFRSCGCISLVISLCGHLTLGKLVLPAAFFLCAFMSLCTGSAFASVASIGIICASVGHMAGIPDALLNGAILSGIYVGDRISPVSSSAALVSQVSDVPLHENLQSMIRRFFLPFLTALILYALLGILFGNNQIHSDLHLPSVSLLCILPVVLILLLSYLKCNSKWILICAIVSGCLLTLLYTDVSIRMVLSWLLTGYRSVDASLSMLNGGGLFSMWKPALIILIATCYIAVFELTEFLNPIQDLFLHLHLSVMGKSILVSVLSSILSGSQTLSVILSSILLKGELHNKKLADTLEDTSILIPAMIPWSTAFSVPAATLSASVLCIPFAFYLYLVPLYACTL